MHVVFYKGNVHLKKASILSYGFNKMGDLAGNEAGVHAEYDAISNLKPLKRKKKLETINMIIIRMSKYNKLQSSKPCILCIRIMQILPIKKGYTIKHIYYSDENGNIVKSNLRTLENSEQHYSRFYKKQNK